MSGRAFLHLPGHTNVPERIVRSIERGMEDRRGSGCPRLSQSLSADMRTVFKTRDAEIFIFPASATGSWEASLRNTLSPGDRVLVASFGAFSTRWADMCRRLGLRVTLLETPWGEGAPVERYEAVLRADAGRAIKAVLICHNETATGVTSDVAALRRAMDAINHPALLYVDGVSAIASIDFQMDEWGVDLAVTGSQGGLMLPPGLGLIAVGDRALDAAVSATLPRGYLDFQALRAGNTGGGFSSTPASGLFLGLREALDMIQEEGLDNVIARHHRLAGGVRRAVEAWGLALCAHQPRWFSDTVSTVMMPPEFDAVDVIQIAHSRYNLSLGAGLMQLSGRAFRIAHLGDLNELMCLSAIGGVEMAMRDAGIPIALGSGVAAAQSGYTRAWSEADRDRRVA